jgi:hypothetical protein
MLSIRAAKAVPIHRDSTKYDVLYEGRRYPPKYVLSLAHSFLTPSGKELRGFKGGSQTNRFLRKLGFKIVKKNELAAATTRRQRNTSRPERRPSASDLSEETTSHRSFWIVSPNVMNNPLTVSAWREASVAFQAAFMGYSQDDRGHKQIGHKFAHVIAEDDVILIARRSGHKPDVVGCGIVRGRFQKGLRGFEAPRGDGWGGALRKLSPFIPIVGVPPKVPLIRGLTHTAALRQLNPRANDDHKLICDWMIQQLSDGAVGNGNRKSRLTPRSRSTSLQTLSHSGQLEFTVRTRQMIKVARKSEANLVKEYQQWLEKQQRELKIANYCGLKCDVYEESSKNLIEAKSSAKREHIRMAVGQLLDYAYLVRNDLGNSNLAILLPRRPEAKVLDWLAELQIAVIWKQKHTFVDNADGRFTYREISQ